MNAQGYSVKMEFSCANRNQIVKLTDSTTNMYSIMYKFLPWGFVCRPNRRPMPKAKARSELVNFKMKCEEANYLDILYAPIVMGIIHFDPHFRINQVCMIPTRTTSATKIGEEQCLGNFCWNIQKAIPVRVFDAIYLSGLYGSCLGSTNGSGRVMVVFMAPAQRISGRRPSSSGMPQQR
jgi:hypothetical protein